MSQRRPVFHLFLWLGLLSMMESGSLVWGAAQGSKAGLEAVEVAPPSFVLCAAAEAAISLPDSRGDYTDSPLSHDHVVHRLFFSLFACTGSQLPHAESFTACGPPLILFIWLHWVSAAARRVLHCSVWALRHDVQTSQ